MKRFLVLCCIVPLSFVLACPAFAKGGKSSSRQSYQSYSSSSSSFSSSGKSVTQSSSESSVRSYARTRGVKGGESRHSQADKRSARGHADPWKKDAKKGKANGDWQSQPRKRGAAGGASHPSMHKGAKNP